jgi:L-lactate dehydrogenase
MKKKVTIIGAGSVGATTAFALLARNAASEVVLIDINTEKALGEALDIKQATPFIDNCDIYAGSYRDAVDSDVVVITSGVGRKPGQSRIELAQTNLNILKAITPPLVAAAPNAKYIIVSNPVDILTYAFTKFSGLPEKQIVGSGTILDTARLRYAISNHYCVAQKNVHCYVFGEHGDSSFIPWSSACISGIHLDEYHALMNSKNRNIPELNKDGMLDYVQNSGGTIIKYKGATFYAVSSAVRHLCAMLLSSSDTITTVSSMMHGEYGIDDVCLSTLTLLGPNGVDGKIPMELTEVEIARLRGSACKLKDVISNLKI